MKAYTTHPTPDVIKLVCPAPPPQAGTPEPPAARKRRLMAQAAANRIKVRELGEGRYRVPSQRKDGRGQPLCRYDVREFPGLGWGCSCEWAERQGLYCDENEIALCAHIAQVLKHVERVNADIARTARRMVERLEAREAGKLGTMQDRKDAARIALHDLYGEVA